MPGRQPETPVPWPAVPDPQTRTPTPTPDGRQAGLWTEELFQKKGSSVAFHSLSAAAKGKHRLSAAGEPFSTDRRTGQRGSKINSVGTARWGHGEKKCPVLKTEGTAPSPSAKGDHPTKPRRDEGGVRSFPHGPGFPG